LQVIDWQRIVNVYASMVWQTEYRLLGNHTDSCECFSEAFVFAVETSQRRFIPNVSVLLTHCAIARAIIRLRQRYQFLQSREQSMDLVFVPSNKSQSGELIQSQDLAGLFRKALSQLPPQEAEAFCLRHLADMTVRQIGKELGINPDTAKILPQRAVLKLQNILGLPSDNKDNEKSLEKFTDALKKEAVPPKPPQDVVDVTLTKLAQLTGGELVTPNKPVTFTERFAAISNTTKGIVAAAVTAAFLIGLVVLIGPANKQAIKTSTQMVSSKTKVVVPTKMTLESQKVPGIIQDITPQKITDGSTAKKTVRTRPAVPSKPAVVQSNVEVKPGYIQGWLVDADGNPVQGQIQLGSSSVVAGKTGSFTIREPVYRESDFILGQAFSSDGKLSCLFVRHKGENTNDLEIVVKPPAGVTGFVVDNNNNPVNDFSLKISALIKKTASPSAERTESQEISSDTGICQTKIFSDGSFDINSIPTGVQLQLNFDKLGFKKTSVNLGDLTAGRIFNLGTVTIKLAENPEKTTSENCSLSGSVINERNEPLAEALTIAQFAEEHISVKTDTSGWYEFKGLPQGAKIQITVSADGYGSSSFEFMCSEPNSEIDIQVFPPAYDRYDKAAPGLFVSKWLNTKPITLEELKGKVVLLCIGDFLDQSAPTEEIKKLYEKYQNRPFAIIAVQSHSSDLPITSNIEELSRQYIEENNISFLFGLDDEMSVVKDMMLPEDRPKDEHLVRAPRQGLRMEGAMYSLYEVKTKPAYYLLDKNGLLRTSPASKNLQEWIDFLLAE
jgi:RNA polymerase sigma-70 factor, ECF subfamily